MDRDIQKEIYEKTIKENQILKDKIKEYKERLISIVAQRKINPKSEWYVSYLQTENFRHERQYAKLQEAYYSILARQRECEEHLKHAGIYAQTSGETEDNGDN